MLTTHYS